VPIVVELIHYKEYAVIEGLSIRVFSAPYFLATKLDAFVDRGENEGRFSSDFEDIVHVLNNRQLIWENNWLSPPLACSRYLQQHLSYLLIPPN